MNFQDLSRPPAVIAVANIDHLLFPSSPPFWAFWRKAQDPLATSLAAAQHVLVPHQRLRKLVLEHYALAPERVHVVGHGPAENDMIGPADSVTRRITKEVYGREQSYFLAPAYGLPYSNTERLVAAYDRFRTRCPEPVRLLLAGEEQEQPRSVRTAIKQARHRADISFLPKRTPHEQAKILASARASLHVSQSSAFPVSILAAWHAEVPVLATDNDMLQGAGALVQGTDVESIAEGLVSLVTTPFLASGLVENGKRRREGFSWEQVNQRVQKLLPDTK